MTTTFGVRFESLPNEYLARRWRIPNHAEPFPAIPPGTRCIFVSQTRSLFVNDRDGKRPVEIGLDAACRWGSNTSEEDTGVIYAKGKNDASTRFCLRMLPNIVHATSNTQSSMFQTFSGLVHDAIFHSTHLTDIEGSFVPIHYGMWVMDTGDLAGKVLFSLTQWCGIPWNKLKHTKMNTEANRVLVGRTFEALHDFGVDHGGLDFISDFRHVLIDVFAPGVTRADLLAGKAPCYIVGFSEATANHQCTRKLPIVPLDVYLLRQEVGCEEIRDVLVLLDFMRPPTFALTFDASIPASQALEWHTKYSALHPDITDTHVLIAQRAKLYPDVAAVYADIDVSFENGDQYSRATITSRVDTDFDELEPEAIVLQDGVDGFHVDSASPDAASGLLEQFSANLQLSKLGDRALLR